MTKSLEGLRQLYAHLLIKIGVNLQPGQGLSLACEPIHRVFAHEIVVAAYQAGAKHVDINWIDTVISKARFQHASAAAQSFFPQFEVAKRRQFVDEKWATLRISGEEFPDIFANVDPTIMRRAQELRFKNTAFFANAQMADAFQWCVCAAPTPNWAQKLFPDLPQDQAVDRLWHTILQSVRVGETDPVAAWQAHDRRLIGIANVLMARRVRELHFVDTVLAEDNLPRTDLKVGLVESPIWVAASAVTPEGIRFLPNMPTEEVFTTPHRLRTNGHVRLSKPAIIGGREVRNAYFEFVDGVVVAHRASHGQQVLDEMLAINGARRLGEVALVDVRSPINQTGILFYDGLFDENAVCHIAFGKAYPTALQNGTSMSAEALESAGANNSDTHEDVMIGTDTMNVAGTCADGTAIDVMRDGKFVL